MAFALGLQESLQRRRRLAVSELATGDSLENVLSRHLLAVEAMAQSELLTSILLLDPDGKQLFHAAAPSLSREYCEVIDGSEIGPDAGSCGTAAYFGHPVYVTDIESDPLWADYRHLALPHGLRACWSTPIRDTDDAILGTFAIYHRTVGSPTPEEIEAIAMITDNVADAILCARGEQPARPRQRKPELKIVSNTENPRPGAARFHRLAQHLDRLESLADELEKCADETGSSADAEAVRSAGADCRRLISVIRSQIENLERSQGPRG